MDYKNLMVTQGSYFDSKSGKSVYYLMLVLFFEMFKLFICFALFDLKVFLFNKVHFKDFIIYFYHNIFLDLVLTEEP